MLSREQMLKKLHLRNEFYRRRGRQSFAEFLRYTKPDYQLSWFHEGLAGELDQFLDDVFQTLTAPDRHLPATGRQIGAGEPQVSGQCTGPRS